MGSSYAGFRRSQNDKNKKWRKPLLVLLHSGSSSLLCQRALLGALHQLSVLPTFFARFRFDAGINTAYLARPHIKQDITPISRLHSMTSLAHKHPRAQQPCLTWLLKVHPRRGRAVSCCRCAPALAKRLRPLHAVQRLPLPPAAAGSLRSLMRWHRPPEESDASASDGWRSVLGMLLARVGGGGVVVAPSLEGKRLHGWLPLARSAPAMRMSGMRKVAAGLHGLMELLKMQISEGLCRAAKLDVLTAALPQRSAAEVVEQEMLSIDCLKRRPCC